MIVNQIPTDICLLEVGDNDSTKGPCVYLPEMAEDLNKQFSGKKFRFDRDHLSLSDAPDLDGKISYGRYDLVAEETGLYARNIEFTDVAEDLIKTGKYECFSIACLIDQETNQLIKMLNTALTNLPADEKALLNRSTATILRTTAELGKPTNFAITNLRSLGNSIINNTTDKDNNMARTKKAVDEQTVVEEVIVRADTEEEDDKEEVVEEKREDVEPEDKKDEEEKREDETICEGCKAMQEEIDGLKAMIEELGGEVRKYRETEDKEKEDKELEEKRSLLKNRSQKVQDFLMKKSLAEVKEYNKNFVKTTSAPVTRSVEIKSDELVDEDYDRKIKQQLGITKPSQRGFAFKS